MPAGEQLIRGPYGDAVSIGPRSESSSNDLAVQAWRLAIARCTACSRWSRCQTGPAFAKRRASQPSDVRAPEKPAPGFRGRSILGCAALRGADFRSRTRAKPREAVLHVNKQPSPAIDCPQVSATQRVIGLVRLIPLRAVQSSSVANRGSGLFTSFSARLVAHARNVARRNPAV